MSSIARLLALLAGIRPGSGSAPPPRPTILFTGAAGPVTASPYPLAVELSDSSNTARVDFFKGTVQIGQRLSAPYTCPAELTFVDNGEVQFRAVVVDKQGNPREVSFKIDVAIGVPDTTAPVPLLTASSLNFTADGTLTLNASGTDAGGAVTLLLTRDGTAITIPPGGEVTEGITRSSNGTHVYLLRATDAAGNFATTTQTVTVAIPLPGATVGVSASPGSVTTARPLALGAVATPPSGLTIKWLDFYRGSVSPANFISRSSSPPYTATTDVTAADNGTLTLIAIATDSQNRTAQGTTNVTVAISGGTPPPTPDPALYVEPDPSTITWSAFVVINDAYLDGLGIVPIVGGPDAGRSLVTGLTARTLVKGQCAIYVNTTRPLLLTHSTASAPSGNTTGQAAIGNAAYGLPPGNTVAVDVVIRDCSVITPGLDLADGQRGGGILFEYAKNIIVENCNFNGVGINLQTCCWGGGTFRAERNRFRNIDGRFRDRSSPNGFSLGGDGVGWYRVQAVQLDKVRGVAGMSIKDNWVTNLPGESRVEDNINTYKSGGTSASPLMIDRNLIDGAYDTVPSNIYSGSAIVMGDEGGEYTTAQRNTAVRTSNTGISMSSTNFGKIISNRIAQTGFAPDGSRVDQNGANIDVGIYARNYASNFFMDKTTNIVDDNDVAWAAPLAGQPGRRLDFGFSDNATEGPIGNRSYTAGAVPESLITDWIADHLAVWAAADVVVGRRVA
ncbi:hypothetical protein [Deinococcus marmoris]|uniref:Alpha-galactosidase n=1 Tax=Deinococcus marmoris TaxID=249408 RepID=A0A1U7P4K9_9DEIO|nr:hypothetical protein [Deinococcus marmoris]OLV20115.1 alpha-galactosidase [Deinococcus marmoris]